MKPSDLSCVVYLALPLTTAFAAGQASAMSPPAPKPLVKRIQDTTHVFIGVAESVRQTSGTPELGQNRYELSVRIREALRPVDREAADSLVYVQTGAGLTTLDYVRKTFVSKELIYLCTQSRNPESGNHVLEHGWYGCEPVQSLAKVRGAIGGVAPGPSIPFSSFGTPINTRDEAPAVTPSTPDATSLLFLGGTGVVAVVGILAFVLLRRSSRADRA